MLKTAKLIFSFCFVLFYSCTNSFDSEIEKLNKDLMAGHDKVMPKSLIINQVKKKLLDKVKDSDESIKNEALQIASELQKAEDDMYAWMDDYSEAMNTENSKEKFESYQKLKVKIDDIAIKTDSSISKAKKF